MVKNSYFDLLTALCQQFLNKLNNVLLLLGEKY